MSNKVKDLINKFVTNYKVDDVFRVGVDSYDSYTYLEKPDDINEDYEKLSNDETIEFDEWEYDILNNLKFYGPECWKQV